MNNKSEKEFLDNYDIGKYPRPSLASDIVLLSLLRDKPNADIKNVNVHALQLLLIKRANHPCINKWALPGGFCKPTESVYQTAKRELFEEANVSNAYLKLAGVHSEIGRDARGWIVSNSWLGLIDRYECELRADTDAWEAVWFTIKSLQTTITNDKENETEYTHELILVNEDNGETLKSVVKETITFYSGSHENVYKNVESDLAFDHNIIITQALVNFKKDIKEDIRPLFNLVPQLFTLGELQIAYEYILGEKTQNFRRRINDYVIETDEFAEVKGYRPAKLYMKNNDMFKYK